MKRTSLFITLGIFGGLLLACNNSDHKQSETIRTQEDKGYDEIYKNQQDSLYSDSVITPETVDTAGTKLDWRTDTIVK